MTQNEMILQYLKDEQGITQLDALREFGCMRLASRINDLKNKGYAIKKIMCKSENRYGKTIRYAKYELEE